MEFAAKPPVGESSALLRGWRAEAYSHLPTGGTLSACPKWAASAMTLVTLVTQVTQEPAGLITHRRVAAK